MEKFYLLALKKIKRLDEIPTKKQWNVIARFENYLSAESIEYISNKSFEELCMEVRTFK